MEILVGLCLCAFATWVGTGLVRRYALARAVLDVPNERSSHTTPVPRGGGLAIAVVLLSGVLLAALTGHVDPRLALALVGGGILVATIGWIDDHRHVPAGWRSLVHFV